MADKKTGYPTRQDLQEIWVISKGPWWFASIDGFTQITGKLRIPEGAALREEGGRKAADGSKAARRGTEVGLKLGVLRRRAAGLFPDDG